MRNVSDSKLVLASASRARSRLLDNAGVSFSVMVAEVDEDSVKIQARKAGKPVSETAALLAEAKARFVSKHQPNAHVIGADQILECDGALFDKPADRGEAEAHLRQLRGKTHRLITACCVVLNDALEWHCIKEAHLSMRSFDDDFMTRYLDRLGEDALASVGAYQLEGLGVQLFSHVEGDFFTILGLPLLPLLDYLEERGLIGK